MSSTAEKRDLMIKVAKLYYADGLSQDQIAKNRACLAPDRFPVAENIGFVRHRADPDRRYLLAGHRARQAD